jgi:hypothetical protein
MKEQNFEDLNRVLKQVSPHQATEFFLSGIIPLTGWSSLNAILKQAQTNKDFLLDEEARIANRIHQLEQELHLLKEQFVDIQQKIRVTNVDQRVFQTFSDCEEKLVVPFREKISCLNLSVDSLSLTDLKIAFHQFGIHRCFKALVNLQMDQSSILDLHFEDLENANLSLKDKLEVLYVVNLISSKQFNRRKHKEICAVCSSDDLQGNLLQNGISQELFDIIKDKISGLELYQVIFYPPREFIRGLTVTTKDRRILHKTWKHLKKTHSSVISK